ncbi:MAG TPA: hypothetical protein VGL24_07245 [Chthoniobacterales bacterium]
MARSAGLVVLFQVDRRAVGYCAIGGVFEEFDDGVERPWDFIASHRMNRVAAGYHAAWHFRHFTKKFAGEQEKS